MSQRLALDGDNVTCTRFSTDVGDLWRLLDRLRSEAIGRRISAEISADPVESELLRRRLAEARAGWTLPWRDMDDDAPLCVCEWPVEPHDPECPAVAGEG